jgi:hypothetical protein
LNSKQPTITNSSLSTARTIGLQDALNGIQDALNDKQATLSLNYNLSMNSLNLNADPGLISLTANSLATFDAVRIDTELMCHANDIFLEQD